MLDGASTSERVSVESFTLDETSDELPEQWLTVDDAVDEDDGEACKVIRLR